MTDQGDLGAGLPEKSNDFGNLEMAGVGVDESHLMAEIEEGAGQREQAERRKVTVTELVDRKVKRRNDAGNFHRMNQVQLPAVSLF